MEEEPIDVTKFLSHSMVAIELTEWPRSVKREALEIIGSAMDASRVPRQEYSYPVGAA